MKLAVLARSSPTLATRLAARTARQKQKIQALTERSAERAFVRVQELEPRDTNYMADHTRIEMREEGLAYLIGWRRGDFVGQTNPATGQEITAFYPVFVTYGTRYMAGRDALTPALQAERPILRRAIARALSA